MEISDQACREIIEEILGGLIHDQNDLQIAKTEIAKRYNLDKIPTNPEILQRAKKTEKPEIESLLRRKPIRSISGIAVVATMTQPYPCPHGRCAYCPGGPEFEAPQSYTGEEPAALRAKMNDYDPYRQVKNRINQLNVIGHPTDKIELIIIGGTFTAQPLCYQEWFIRRCLDALSDGQSQLLEEAIKKCEKAKYRPIGLTIETRPDYCKKIHINRLLGYGVTRVELGVQSIYDHILKRVERGHLIRDTVEATQLLRDSGLKVAYHVMPGLPGSNFQKDVAMFKKIFRDERFKPDMVKIYPTLVIKGTKLYDWWKNGKYKPLTTETARDLIIEMKKIMPKWMRTMRINRDIPAFLIDAGIQKSNLGQLVYEKLRALNIKCRCIRCREIGHKMLKEEVEATPENIRLFREDYAAAGGTEIFLSFEDVMADALIGFIRLRIPSDATFRSEITPKSALVRELHVYGSMLRLGEKPTYEWQHRGYGEELLTTAEKIAQEEFDIHKILITSGIGVREYYRKLGYRLEGPYMVRELTSRDF